jgi:hypothetical protein
MTTAFTRRTELAHRTSDGIDVYVSWNEPTSRVTVGVLDARSDDSFELEVEGCRALDAFNHPYAYAAASSAGGESKSTNHQPWRTEYASTDR